MQFQKGFTIVELLVVITIIVVMLALLAPALDKAVYQTELALCGSKIHAVMGGAQTYAVGNKRQYPSSRRDISSERPAYSIKYPTGPDERTYLRTFLSLNDALNCPLRKKIDIETTRPQAAIYVGYALWFGFIYKAGTPERGMYKLGDRFTWDGKSYDLLTSDYVGAAVTVSDGSQGYGLGSHPDYDGVWFNDHVQDVPNPWVANGLAPSQVAGDVTYSWWYGGPSPRGPVDSNFGYQDGSVRRRNRILWEDPDMSRIPDFMNDRTPARRMLVPPQ